MQTLRPVKDGRRWQPNLLDKTQNNWRACSTQGRLQDKCHISVPPAKSDNRQKDKKASLASLATLTNVAEFLCHNPKIVTWRVWTADWTSRTECHPLLVSQMLKTDPMKDMASDHRTEELQMFHWLLMLISGSISVFLLNKWQRPNGKPLIQECLQILPEDVQKYITTEAVIITTEGRNRAQPRPLDSDGQRNATLLLAY